MEFFKAHGTGNDFVVLPDLADAIELDADLVRALCDRRFGVGADGVIRIGRGGDGADAFMDYRNADGSTVEMCGNGVRVVAKHLVDHGFVTDDVVRVRTRAGVKDVGVDRRADGTVATATVDMGEPVLDPADIPFHAMAPGAPSEPLDVDGETVVVSAVSLGNPHAVIVVDDVATAPVSTLGPRLEHDERFPKGVNVGFAEPVSRDDVRVRVWERGVGETAACGTGACAAVVALQRRGYAAGLVRVHLPGGILTVRYLPEEAAGVRLTGPAVEVARGRLSDGWNRQP